MAEFLVQIVIGLLRTIAIVYDIVSFVPYYIACRPREKLQRSRRIKARQFGESDVTAFRGVDIPLNKLTTTLFPECQTLDDLSIRAAQVYGSKRCLGTRELLSEEDEMQPNGRVFKKVQLLE